jgi:hypothetical protein
MDKRFYAFGILVTVSVISYAAEQGVTADVCPQKLATLERLKNELQATRAVIRENATKLEELTRSRGQAGAAQVATEAAKVAKPGYQWLKNVGGGLAVARVNQLSTEMDKTNAVLTRNRENEARLAKELALEESLAPKCLQQAAAAAAAKPAFPNIAGPYNSPYGHTVLTQAQESGGVAHVEGTVHYDKSANTPEGGTSKLQGGFNGRTWTFTWRNSYGHHGDGQLTLLEDGTGMKGWWIDKKLNPPQRGNWWLYRK